jgi:hypothetical protein
MRKNEADEANETNEALQRPGGENYRKDLVLWKIKEIKSTLCCWG